MHYQMKKDLYIINALYLLRGLYEEMPSRAFCRGTSFLSIKFYAFPEEFFGFVMLWTVFLICDDWKQFEASCTVQEC